MKGQDLYEALSHVDPVMAEEAVRPMRRRAWRRYLLTAACVCLLLAGGALAAEAIFGVQITGIFYNERESGYRVLPELEPYPAENFSSPSLTQALEEVRQQYLEHQPEDSEFQGGYRFLGDTWGDCEEFLGISLPNPLESAEGLSPLSSDAVPLSRYNAHCSIILTADASGNLGYVLVSTCYEMDAYKISLRVDFSVEGNGNDPELRVFYDGEADFDVDTYPLADGQKAALLTARKETMSYTKTTAYFVRADGIYTLSVWRSGTGHEEAVREKLCELLDLF